MDRLEQRHIDFLRTCAGSPNKIHSLPDNVTEMEANAMATEMLLIRYNKIPGKAQYAIGRYGAQFVKEGYGATESPDMIKLAIDYIMGKGYSEAEAMASIGQHGVEKVLEAQAMEMRQGSQREVKVPLNEQGKPEIKFRG
jgi:hypothetical protein